MTKLEHAWLDAITQLGCIVCLIVERVRDTPAEPHHLLSGGRRRGHLFTIPLCPTHHRSGRADETVTSRDQCRRRFEERYGSEEALLDRTRRIVEERFGVFVGVDIDAVNHKLGAVRSG